MKSLVGGAFSSSLCSTERDLLSLNWKTIAIRTTANSSKYQKRKKVKGKTKHIFYKPSCKNYFCNFLVLVPNDFF
jgi:hypothetical protein